MRRSFLVGLVVCGLVAMAGTAAADWRDFWYRVDVDFHRMNCWPDPFRHADRQMAITPLIAMTDAGWRLQNTLTDNFFDAERQSLTQAGQLKVRWAAMQTPSHRRLIYVLRGSSAQETMQRVQAVQQYLDKISPAGPRPEVLLTDAIPPGGSGEYLDAVDRQRKQSIPAPRLPEMQEQELGN